MKKLTLLSIALLIGLTSYSNPAFTMQTPNNDPTKLEILRELEALQELSQSILNNQEEITNLKLSNEIRIVKATTEEENNICTKNTEIIKQKNIFLKKVQKILQILQKLSPKNTELDSLTNEISQLTEKNLSDKKIAKLLKKLGKSYESLTKEKSSNCFITFKVMLIISFVIMMTAIIIARIQNVDINNLWNNLIQNKSIEQCINMVKNFLNKTAEMIIEKASINRDHLCLNYGKFCN
ncbi:MAG: hypothetical protein ABH827_01665 [bacterium]